MTTSLSSAPLAHDAVPAFVTGGRALFTVVGKASRFTFKVSAPKADKGAPEKSPVRFVSVLTGNEYTFLGTVFAESGVYRRSPKSAVGEGAPSAVAAAWFFGRVAAKATLPPALEVWHHGKCCRCGRTLTVPSSLTSGLGPECAKKVLG